MYIWNEEEIDLTKIMFQMKKSVKNRVGLLIGKHRNYIDIEWFKTL